MTNLFGIFSFLAVAALAQPAAAQQVADPKCRPASAIRISSSATNRVEIFLCQGSEGIVARCTVGNVAKQCGLTNTILREAYREAEKALSNKALKMPSAMHFQTAAFCGNDTALIQDIRSQHQWARVVQCGGRQVTAPLGRLELELNGSF